MYSQFFDVALTVSGVFLVMIVGGFARHQKWLTSEVDKSLASFTANVLLPALFFQRIMSDKNLSMHADAWIPALYGFVCTAGGFLFAFLIARTIGRYFGLKSDSEQRTFGLCTGIDNYGYVPYPLAEVFFPACYVSLMIHNVGVDIALWSVGLFVIAGQSITHAWRRIVLSPPLLAVAVALAVRQFECDGYVPRPMLHMCDQLGRCYVPMGLVLSGAIIYDFASKFRWAQAWRPLLLAVMVRILILPAAILLLAKYTTSHRELQQVLLLQAAMPAATFPVVLTRLYNQSVETAWTIVVGTSVLGLISIPLWMLFANWFLGF